MDSMFEATETAVRPEAVMGRVKRDANGAMVSFIGSLRPASVNGVKVLHGRLDVDGPQAERYLRELGEELRSKWQVEDVSMCHKVGRVEVGETILVVAIGAPHRQEAFEACQYAVDRIKEFMPLIEVLEGQ